MVWSENSSKVGNRKICMFWLPIFKWQTTVQRTREQAGELRSSPVCSKHLILRNKKNTQKTTKTHQPTTTLHLLFPQFSEHLRADPGTQHQIAHVYMSCLNTLQNIYILLFWGLHCLKSHKKCHNTKYVFTLTTLLKVQLVVLSLPAMNTCEQNPNKVCTSCLPHQDHRMKNTSLVSSHESLNLTSLRALSLYST